MKTGDKRCVWKCNIADHVRGIFAKFRRGLNEETSGLNTESEAEATYIPSQKFRDTLGLGTLFTL